jgi:fatty acid-binding protein DegV
MRRQVKNASRSYKPEDFKVTIIADSTCLTEPWVETGFAHVPIIATVKGEPYPNSFEPPGLSVNEFLNKSRHSEVKVGTAAPAIELYKRLYTSAAAIGKPILSLAPGELISRTVVNARTAADDMDQVYLASSLDLKSQEGKPKPPKGAVPLHVFDHG